ncbi:hypothetical protein RRG08_031974 [Elysia crispata]|uniref:Uncharacterized protein n=1 Tax=Elysia crispata TaxID=231223 RepID=A0AAE0Z414_9GAST|nr:hypothetical protein RRG08_031974 [Elysia crispata]
MRIAFILCLAFHIMPVDSLVTSTPNTIQDCLDIFLEAVLISFEESYWCSAAEEYATCVNGLTNLRSPTLKQTSILKLSAWFRYKPSCDVESLING